MARSIWKGPFSQKSIYNKLKFQQSNKILYLKKKSNLILPEYLNKKVKIYNGMLYHLIQVSKEMIGLKFGNFVFTRKLHVYKK